jgi:hypothetical protein
MLNLAASKCCSVPYPLSLIYRRRPEKLTGYALRDGKLVKVPVEILKGILQN